MAATDPIADILGQITRRTVEFGRQVPEEAELVGYVLIRIPRLAALLAAGGANHDEAGGLVDAIISEASAMIPRRPDQAAYVTDLVAALTRLAGAANLKSVRRGDQRKGRRRGHKRSGEGIQYHRRLGRRGEPILVESRPGTTRDFHLSKADYDRAIETMAKSAVDKAVRFDEIEVEFVHRGGRERKSSFPLRVVLRFWRSLSPPLVQRHRALYAISGSAGQFRRAARKAWTNLPESNEV